MMIMIQSSQVERDCLTRKIIYTGSRDQCSTAAALLCKCYAKLCKAQCNAMLCYAMLSQATISYFDLNTYCNATSILADNCNGYNSTEIHKEAVKEKAGGCWSNGPVRMSFFNPELTVEPATLLDLLHCTDLGLMVGMKPI